MAAPAPAQSAPPATSSSGKTQKNSNTAGSSQTESSRPADSRQTEHVSSSTDMSFLSFLMAGFLNNNSQNFSATSVTGTSQPVSDMPSPPLTFGGTFNMDPSMLVLPEGVDAQAILNSAEFMNFSAELLAALTPGVPGQQVAVSLDGAVATGEAVNPLLIATGLDPMQMQEFLDRITALAAEKVNAASGTTVPVTVSPAPVVSTTTAVEAPVLKTSDIAIVSFLPDEPPADEAPVANTIIKAAVDASISTEDVAVDTENVAKQSGNAPYAKKVTDIVAKLEIPAEGIPVEDDGFDPVEFRLAGKPFNYSSAKPYQTVAPVVVPSAAQAQPVSEAVANAIKGEMQSAGGADAPAFRSSFAADPTSTASASITTGFDPLLSTTALTPTPAQSGGLTNPVLQNISAVQSHPATQAVAAVINRQAQQGDGTKTLAIQLDPPELGKMQLKMKYEKGEPLRVHIVLEKADTMAMFQRDAHSLQNILSQAGLQTDSGSLTFDLAGQQSFGEAMGDQGGDSGRNGSAWTSDTAGSDEVIETSLSLYVDPDTGLTRYNALV